METNNEWIEIGSVQCYDASLATFHRELMVKNVFGHLVYGLKSGDSIYNVLIEDHAYKGIRFNAKAGYIHFCFTPIA